MIPAERLGSALYAFNGLLVGARQVAREQGATELEAILDVAEYLPWLLARREDSLRELAGQLASLAQRLPRFRFAVDRLEAEAPLGWRMEGGRAEP